MKTNCYKCGKVLNLMVNNYCCKRIHFEVAESRGKVVAEVKEEQETPEIIYEASQPLVIVKKKKKRRSRRIGIPLATKIFVKRRDKSRCVKCGSKNDIHLHHIIHVEHGGSNEPENLQTLCYLCHIAEHEGENVYGLMIESFWKYEVVREG